MFWKWFWRLVFRVKVTWYHFVKVLHWLHLLCWWHTAHSAAPRSRFLSTILGCCTCLDMVFVIWRQTMVQACATFWDRITKNHQSPSCWRRVASALLLETVTCCCLNLTLDFPPNWLYGVEAVVVKGESKIKTEHSTSHITPKFKACSATVISHYFITSQT